MKTTCFRFRLIFVAVIAISGLTACNFTNTDATPTSDAPIEEPINPLPERTEVTDTPAPTIATLAPSPSPQTIIQIASGTPTPTAGLPTETTTPQATEGPWEYVVQPGDSLNNIIARPPFNYRNFNVIDDIVALNNLRNSESITAGQTILIPRPTPTPVPVGVELTAAACIALGLDSECRVIGVQTGPYTVREGESAVSIADQYGVTLENLRDLNPDINWFGCNFEIPSGGDTCAPILSIGQNVNVPLPTTTPTLSPTPSGSETPTPTPTYPAPRLAYPPEGGLAPGGIIDLEWVSVGILAPSEFYLIEVTDVTLGTNWSDVTKNTELSLPESLIPTDGRIHEIIWRISIAAQNAQGTYGLVGSAGNQRTFFWQSR